MNRLYGNEIILNVIEISVELIESEEKYIKIVISHYCFQKPFGSMGVSLIIE